MIIIKLIINKDIIINKGLVINKGLIINRVIKRIIIMIKLILSSRVI